MGRPADSVTTICLQTVDASARDDAAGRISFDLGAALARTRPTRVMLGSLEFPMVQYAVEPAWCRVYLCEALRLTPDARALVLREREDGGGGGPGPPPPDVRVPLPLTLNPVRRVRAGDNGRRLAVTLLHPHGLWARPPSSAAASAGANDDGDTAGGGAAAAPPPDLAAAGRWPTHGRWPGGDLWLLHPAGALRLRPERLEYVTGKTFAVRLDPGAPAGLLQPLVPERGECGYLLVPPPPSPDALCAALNSALAGDARLRSAVRLRFDAGTGRAELSAAGRADRLGLRGGADLLVPPGARVALPPAGLALGGFDHIELPPGFYAPAHRPMGTGPALRMTAELEGQLNRLNFAAPAPSAAGEPAPPPCLVVRGPEGRVRAASIPHGTYTPFGLADALQAALNGGAGGPAEPAAYTFRYDPAAEVFAAGCAVDGRPARFDLLFTHPLSLDPARLGFPGADHCGDSRYESAPVHFPRFEWPRAAPEHARAQGRFHSNLYRAYELHGTKRLAIGHAARPVLPAARLADALPPAPVLAVVLLPEAADAAAGAAGPDRLRLYVPGLDPAGLPAGRALGVEFARQPFSLAFQPGLPRSIGGRRLGFPDRMVQHGLDGAVRAGGGGGGRPLVLAPPFEAPHVHSLDHPDYVVIHLEEGKLSTGLQHRAGGRVTAPLAKIALYPLFRDERMVPREAALTGEWPGRITLRFENPDGSPYQFHGAQFSLTLNFVHAGG